MATCTGLGASVSIFSGPSSTGTNYVDNWRFTSIGGFSEGVENLDDTALDSSGFMEMCPSGLKSCEPLELECYWEFDEALPTIGDVGTIVIDFPLQEDDTSPAGTLNGSGFISSISTPTLTPNGTTVGTITVQFDGKTGPTWTKTT